MNILVPLALGALTVGFLAGSWWATRYVASKLHFVGVQRDELARRLNRIIEKDRGQPIAGSLAHAIKIAKGEIE